MQINEQVPEDDSQFNLTEAKDRHRIKLGKFSAMKRKCVRS